MGEVYRAHDSKLGRDVAIKILPAAWLIDDERRARFDREARTLASLNHPNIGAIYGVEDFDDSQALVLELVEGPTLADRLVTGPLPTREALAVASQIANALDAAHQSGIIHRDLKPANIKIRNDGQVKVLDFGLAKTAAREPSRSVTHALTANAPTEEGIVLGTVAYMSPEQARGAAVDKRTDVWAFGCVVYEMLTSRAPFARQTPSDSIAAILEHEPDWEALPQTTPPVIRRLLQRCLEKDVARRLRDVGDAMAEIDDAQSDASSALRTTASRHTKSSRLSLVIGTTAVLSAVLAAAAAWMLKPAPATSSAPIVRLSVSLPDSDVLGPPGLPALAISPDGRTLAYTASRGGRATQLFVRGIDSSEATALADTEGAYTPFFSPDGRWIGFFAQGKLKKILAAGGGLTTLTDGAFAMGGAWGPDDTIYFSPFNMAGIWRIPAAGGTAEEFSRLDRIRGEVSHRFPQVLDDGKTVLFTVWTGPGWDEKHLEVQVGNEKHRRLISGASTGRFIRSGHIVYSKAIDLVVVPFDVTTLKVTGSPVTLADRPREVESEGAQYGVSNNGTLVYVPGNEAVYQSQLVWVRRDGAVEPTGAPTGGYTDPVISPDGRSAAVSIQGPTMTLWTLDFARSTLATLTASGSNQAPRWTPDGRRLIYRGTRAGYRNLFWRSADGAGDEERLTTSESVHTPGSPSPDGTYAIYTDISPETGRDIWMLDLRQQPRAPQPLVRTRAQDLSAEISPDGRWLAYQSDESGRPEIYLRPFPNPGGRIPISRDGGTEPRWSRDGRELFYRYGGKMMVVALGMRSTPTPDQPRALFEDRFQVSDTGSGGYDVAADGRFLMVLPAIPDERRTRISVVLGWFDDVRARTK
jgi:serine/threonine-protein kinase